MRGEEIATYVKLKVNRNTTVAELRRYLRDRLAAYKIPDRLEVVEKLPRGIAGKANFNELRRRARGTGPVEA